MPHCRFSSAMRTPTQMLDLLQRTKVTVDGVLGNEQYRTDATIYVRSS